MSFVHLLSEIQEVTSFTSKNSGKPFPPLSPESPKIQFLGNRVPRLGKMHSLPSTVALFFTIKSYHINLLQHITGKNVQQTGRRSKILANVW